MNVDNHYSLEINSILVSRPIVPGHNPLRDQTVVSSSNAWIDSFAPASGSTAEIDVTERI